SGVLVTDARRGAGVGGGGAVAEVPAVVGDRALRVARAAGVEVGDAARGDRRGLGGEGRGGLVDDDLLGGSARGADAQAVGDREHRVVGAGSAVDVARRGGALGDRGAAGAEVPRV